MDWHAMILLGAYHGINPGMGWLFAVALGMQQRRALGTWLALPPLALGHALAVGAVLVAASAARVVLPLDAVKAVVGLALLMLGCYRLWRHRHPRFGGMQVGFRDLTIWSFLMASAHGAGLMLVPFVVGPSGQVAAFAHGAHAAGSAAGPGVIALAIHTAAYLVVAGLAAWVVYRKLGLGVLRTAWLNLDWLWAGALVVTGVFVLLI
jgi:hypothetical protein